MKGRTAAAYVCQACDKKFHPLYGSRKLYCSPQCAGKGVGIKRRGAQAAAAEAAAARRTPEDDRAFLASLLDSPSDWDDEEELFS